MLNGPRADKEELPVIFGQSLTCLARSLWQFRELDDPISPVAGSHKQLYRALDKVNSLLEINLELKRKRMLLRHRNEAVVTEKSSSACGKLPVDVNYRSR